MFKQNCIMANFVVATQIVSWPLKSNIKRRHALSLLYAWDSSYQASTSIFKLPEVFELHLKMKIIFMELSLNSEN